MISFACPRCRTAYQYSDDMAGKKVRCTGPNCRMKLRIPASAVPTLVNAPAVPAAADAAAAHRRDIDGGVAPMPSPSTGNLTPSLHCPKCMQPFRIPRDKIGALLRCKRCKLYFRVAHDGAGGYAVHKEGSAAAIPAAPRTIVPERRPAPPSAPAYPGAHRRPGADKPAAPPTIRPGESLSLDEDSTMLGKPIVPPNGLGRESDGANGAPPSQPLPPAPAAASNPAAPASSRVGLALLAIVVGAGLAVIGYLFIPWKGGGANPGGAVPVSLGKYGGIEIGSTGVKRVGVEYFKADGEIKEVLLDELDFNPKLANLQRGATDFNDGALKDTVAGVGDYFDALTKLGVPPENIYIACSSGVLEPFNTDEVRQRNHDRLVKAVCDKIGRDKISRDPEFIEAHDEAKYSFQLVVPKNEWADAVLIDVGGNNIKGGGFIRNTFRDFTVEAGASSFEKKVGAGRNKDETFAEAAHRLSNMEIEAPLDAELGDKTELKERKKVYFLGGLPWALATYTHPVEFYTPTAGGGGLYYCRLDAREDLDRFGEMVRDKKPADIKAEVLAKAAGQNKVVADALADNVDKIQKDVFQKQDRLVGGAEILTVLDSRFALKAENKEVWVFRYGQVAWLLRFVQERSGHLIETKSPVS
jgi:hypothetical protein